MPFSILFGPWNLFQFKHQKWVGKNYGTRLCQLQRHISCDTSVGSPASPPQTPGIKCWERRGRTLFTLPQGQRDESWEGGACGPLFWWCANTQSQFLLHWHVGESQPQPSKGFSATWKLTYYTPLSMKTVNEEDKAHTHEETFQGRVIQGQWRQWRDFLPSGLHSIPFVLGPLKRTQAYRFNLHLQPDDLQIYNCSPELETSSRLVILIGSGAFT